MISTFIAEKMVEMVGMVKYNRFKVQKRKLMLVHNIVMKFMNGNHCKDHSVITNIFLTSIEVFEELSSSRIYITRTM
jgi:calcineurin-like phosphoesterase family protein